MKKIIIINREGGIIRQSASPLSNTPVQGIDLLPGVIGALRELCRDTDYRLVLFTRRPYFPEDLIPRLFAGEGITFDTVWSEEEATKTWKDVYLNEIWDKSYSYFIGTFPEDQPLTKYMVINGIWLNEGNQTWTNVVARLKRDSRKITRTRRTSETDITISLDLNGTGEENIDTGIAFFDHMLQQIARHGQVDLTISARGDLQVDAHHTIEDTALLLGSCFRETLGSKKGINRYGFALPMDESRAEVLLDFGGRSWLEWKVRFNREQVGDFPTEMARHFFASFCQNAGCNLHVTASGENDHHLLEAIFKAFGRSISTAIRQTREGIIPSTKGSLNQ